MSSQGPSLAAKMSRFFLGFFAGAIWLTFLYNSTGDNTLMIALWHTTWKIANIVGHRLRRRRLADERKGRWLLPALLAGPFNAALGFVDSAQHRVFRILEHWTMADGEKLRP